jgi:hypothetical protein
MGPLIGCIDAVDQLCKRMISGVCVGLASAAHRGVLSQSTRLYSFG